MSYEIHADYSQTFLFPPSLDEWISEDHPARFIRDVVDGLALDELGFKVRSASTGAPSYSSELLLKVWLYGYFECICSPRRLERSCMNHVGFMWLTGLKAPDHNTLWRFWKEHKSLMKGLFRSTVRVAAKLELVGLVLHAVDGTKIRSQASWQGAWHRDDLEKELERLDSALDEYERSVDAVGGEEAQEGGYRMPEPLRNAQDRREKIMHALDELDALDKKHLHPQDPDARLMQAKAGIEWAYNAQAVVDADSGMVVGIDVTSEETDRHQLTNMLDETKATLGVVADVTVADGGYNNGEELADAQSKGYTVLVSEHGKEASLQEPYHAEHFQYDPQTDCYVCPQGCSLPYDYTDTSSRPYPVRRYRCRLSKTCPVREQCSRTKRGRTIKRSPFEDAIREHNERRNLPENRKLLGRRKEIIEHVFGWAKHDLGIRRWTMVKIENVMAQWALICITWNLKIIYKHWKSGQKPDKKIKLAFGNSYITKDSHLITYYR